MSNMHGRRTKKTLSLTINTPLLPLSLIITIFKHNVNMPTMIYVNFSMIDNKYIYNLKSQH
jgi:hypothetical protein